MCGKLNAALPLSRHEVLTCYIVQKPKKKPTWLNKKSGTKTHELSDSAYLKRPEDADPKAEGRLVVAGVGKGGSEDG